VAAAAAAAMAAPAAAAVMPAAGGPAIAARTLVVRTLGNAGPGSLRAAITAANASAPGSATRIDFAVRGTISGNAGIGVTLLSRTRMNRVLNNYIGLGRFGHALPDTGRPVLGLGTGNKVLGNRTVPLPHP
jgi:hypothetical protein